MSLFVKHRVWALILMSLFFLSCSEALRSNVASNGANAVPLTFENPERDQGDDPSQENRQDPQTQESDNQQTDNKKPEEQKEGTEQANEHTQKKPSRLMYYAQKIMETEGRKIGTACNFYVHRVLQAAGFAYKIYLANDFDQYAKNYFSNYKSENFNHDGSTENVKRLKNYLWTHPERTPFIMNWTRSGRHGHIALVERIDDKLVIYQASLGTKTARKDQTTPDILLNGYNRRQLTVYSEMTPK